MSKIKREELKGKFLEAFDKIVHLKNSDDAKKREAGIKGEKALENILSRKKGEAVKKEVKPKATENDRAKEAAILKTENDFLKEQLKDCREQLAYMQKIFAMKMK